MEVITKYKAIDGLEFLAADDCLDHEKNLVLAAGIMSSIPERPEDSSFSNGSGYIQHDKLKLLQARNRFLEFAKRYSDHKFIQQTIDGGLDIDYGWAGRIIGEFAPQSIYSHWYRFGCIDGDFREWGQPFFVKNPSEASQVQINK